MCKAATFVCFIFIEEVVEMVRVLVYLTFWLRAC